jgi:hypothetical protein
MTTTGEKLRELSTAPIGSSAMDCLLNISGGSGGTRVVPGSQCIFIDDSSLIDVDNAFADDPGEPIAFPQENPTIYVKISEAT